MPYFMKILVIYGISAPVIAVVSTFEAYDSVGWGWPSYIVFAGVGILPASLFFFGSVGLVLKCKSSRICYIAGWLATVTASGAHPEVIKDVDWTTLVVFNTAVVLVVAWYLYSAYGVKKYFSSR